MIYIIVIIIYIIEITGYIVAVTQANKNGDTFDWRAKIAAKEAANAAKEAAIAAKEAANAAEAEQMSTIDLATIL